MLIPLSLLRVYYSVCVILNKKKQIFRIASDKKMHEVVVMSDVISRLANSLKVDSIIDLVNPHYCISFL